ncbi:hypothetical protein CBR_g70724 [Chara braunii]|uniref:Stomatal closure-related actin-binding protein coiled-coil domain-containing protein n=1 Tax=Chara braunii TaxID=69332 RepID=A0A388K9Z3_CHABU|nr:hypothetical protein CBR_g70724 [Chara braunii]|eukprot:GBG66847.1 hypothetical protein CBR_g70724 [Chara braunii]
MGVEIQGKGRRMYAEDEAGAMASPVSPQVHRRRSWSDGVTSDLGPACGAPGHLRQLRPEAVAFQPLPPLQLVGGQFRLPPGAVPQPRSVGADLGSAVGTRQWTRCPVGLACPKLTPSWWRGTADASLLTCHCYHGAADVALLMWCCYCRGTADMALVLTYIEDEAGVMASQVSSQVMVLNAGMAIPPATPLRAVSADVSFSTDSCFSSFKLSNSGMMDQSSDEEGLQPTKNELILREDAALAEQHKRLSVCDLTHKFERGLSAASTAAAKINEEPVPSVTDGNQLGMSLISVVKQRLLGLQLSSGIRYKEDIDEALASMEALGAQWALRENDTKQERLEVRKMAALFKQANEDARRMVEEARTMAQEEIMIAREKVRRAEEIARRIVSAEAREDEREQKMEDLKREVIEARRIKMLHQPTKASEMEMQIQGLQRVLVDKSQEVMSLRHELEAFKFPNKKEPPYKLEGLELLGSTLYVMATSYDVPTPSSCELQWYRIHEDGESDPITGAIRAQYAPEPLDVGCCLRVTIRHAGILEIVESSGPLEASPGLEDFVNLLQSYGNAPFNVVVIQYNGEYVERRAPHVLEISRARVKLRRGRVVKARGTYNHEMWLCGARGGGEAAAQALFLQTRAKQYVLALESERERNGAIMLARRFATEHNVHLMGPGESDSHIER